MSISLVKGQKIDLTKGNAGLNKVVFGLGWDTNRYDGNADFDLDVSAFFTDDNTILFWPRPVLLYSIVRFWEGSFLSVTVIITCELWYLISIIRPTLSVICFNLG